MRISLGALLPLLATCHLACTAKDDGGVGVSSASGGSQSAGANGGGPSTGGAVTGAGGSTATTVTYPKACSTLYDPSVVPVFELTIAPDQLAQMETDCEDKVKQYRPATFKYGAETAEVMVRIKGNWSWRCEKKQFLISFNETNPDGRFHGQRKIVLDAPWYDPSLLAERLGFSFMRRVGVPWSCVNNAKLMLNGTYYGAYANVERVDKEYLQRHFPGAEADGNLYDGGVELRTNEDVANNTRRDALMAATNVAGIDALVELEEAVKVWAASAMLPDTDSYWAGVEINYFLYDHPSRGFLWFPYDMDLMMRQGTTNEASSTVQIGIVDSIVHANPFTYQNPSWGRERLYQLVMSDATWCARFLDALRAARAAYDVNLMSQELDTWAAQISDAVAQDPHKPYTNQNHLDALANLKEFMRQRVSFVDGWLPTATCPVTRWPRN